MDECASAGRATILFHRSYTRFSGGHLKHLHYVQHCAASDFLTPKVYVTPDSSRDQLWSDWRVDRFEPERADLLFVAGMDWNALAPWPGIEERKTVVNLIQHVRHAEVGDRRSAFLSRRAVRLCVSEEVAEALLRTGRCNGPIHVVPNGIEPITVAPLPIEGPVFIGGLKDPRLAEALRERLLAHGVAAHCETTPLPRDVFLGSMASASVAVLLPRPTEGFFLPALEAMAAGVPLICPDCVGNRSFCTDGQTCLMPGRDPDALAAAALRLLSDEDLRTRLKDAGLEKSRHYGLDRERRAFLTILRQSVCQR